MLGGDFATTALRVGGQAWARLPMAAEHDECADDMDRFDFDCIV
jgi:hypothetical protein